jgi:CRISPR-associated protein Csm5
MFTLRVLSPLHIGSRDGTLRATDFIVHEGKVHLINEDRFASFLAEHDAVEKFVEACSHGRVQIEGFLEKLSVPVKSALKKITAMSIPTGEARFQQFKPFIRDGSGQVYLPGSSLKGSLRTAILFRLLQDPTWKDRVEQRINDQPPCEGKGREKREKYSSKLLIKEAMQDFDLEGTETDAQDPKTDILRCLTVRDAYPLHGVRTRVIQVRFLSLGPEKGFYWSRDKKRNKELSLWVEAVTEGTFQAEILWDNATFAKFRTEKPSGLPVKCLDEVLDAVQAMNHELVEYEKDHFAKSQSGEAAQVAKQIGAWYGARPERECLMRLGFGGGMLSATMALHLSQELRQIVRNNCGHSRPGEVAPKSRRVCVSEQQNGKVYCTFGWMAIENLRTAGQTGEQSLGGKSVPDEAEPVTEVWEKASLEWNRGNQTLTAKWSDKTATAKGLEKVPESLRPRLTGKKKKTVYARVVVEVAGIGYFRILTIEDTTNAG